MNAFDLRARGLTLRGEPPVSRRESTAGSEAEGIRTYTSQEPCQSSLARAGDERSADGGFVGEARGFAPAGALDVLSDVPSFEGWDDAILASDSAQGDSAPAVFSVPSYTLILLDTDTITDAFGLPGSALVRAEWHRDLERRTAVHRESRARALEQKAAQRERAERMGGGSDDSAKQRGKWHRDRARGCRERIARAIECGKDADHPAVVVCGACDARVERCRTCNAGLVCWDCRKQRLTDKRLHFASCREAVLEQAAAQGFLHPQRPGGRWSEKLLTFTCPADADERDDAGDMPRVIKNRMLVVRDAWRPFTQSMNRWLRSVVRVNARVDERLTVRDVERGKDHQWRAAWFRTFEWTPGRHDGGGHPHYHVWFFGPFLPHEIVTAWWRRALVAQGLDVDRLGAMKVDLRHVTDGRGAALEVIKYLTKDIVPGGELLSAELYAPVYETLDGKRVTHATCGFMSTAPRPPAACQTCGVVGMLSIRNEKQKEATNENRKHPDVN